MITANGRAGGKLLVAMSPAPSLRQQWISGNIIRELGNALNITQCSNGCKVYNFIGVKIREDTVIQPDANSDCYQQFGVRYYLIVDVNSNQVTIYFLADGRNYSRQSPRQFKFFYLPVK
jgi:Uma2 family endonuclease